MAHLADAEFIGGFREFEEGGHPSSSPAISSATFRQRSTTHFLVQISVAEWCFSFASTITSSLRTALAISRASLTVQSITHPSALTSERRLCLRHERRSWR